MKDWVTRGKILKFVMNLRMHKFYRNPSQGFIQDFLLGGGGGGNIY